ncbi:alpha/beta hydrolase [Duganella radicis]|uniref:Alpha/beta hydrolase fold domain-containing protein n=1 Tax=Duganella radicis TaxID=551988 RepID=A0A6L6PD39_9BURK|nr:alpha/beta hydrolase [Duganella radicis]MTV36996.1 alpha/beta hydrolase fold domain-containing protein [Duganella radicis]
MKKTLPILLTVLLAQAGLAASLAPLPPPPLTISVQAQFEMNKFQQNLGEPPAEAAQPGPDDIEAWRPLQENFIKWIEPFSRPLLRQFHYTQAARTIGGVPVIEVTPAHWKNDGKVMVYVHGGGYVFGSAASNLLSAVLAADATHMRVVAVDHTVAPRGKWQQATSEVVSVLTGLKNEGYPLRSIAVFGDSAGGGLAAGAVLKMRDQGLGMPGAVVLWSPWSDITEAGDTYATLKDVDFLRYKEQLGPAAAAYAAPAEQKNPYVSPVYGDYSKGFPPTLIQGGTREIFLSNFIRQYQAIDSAGGDAKLDLYEGLPHVFQVLLANTPESQLALRKMNEFLQARMRDVRVAQP